MTDDETGQAVSPVTRKIRVTGLPAAGRPVAIEADASQRQALADIHGLIAVDAFVADLVATNWKDDGVRLTGQVTARIVQRCVVSLGPIETDVVAPVDLILVPEGSPLSTPVRNVAGEHVVDVDEDDGPDTFKGNTIDAGAIAEEFFALALDPYPRKEGAQLDTAGADLDGDEREPSPFANLADLMRKS